jgi:hypothetical protein
MMSYVVGYILSCYQKNEVVFVFVFKKIELAIMEDIYIYIYKSCFFFFFDKFT